MIYLMFRLYRGEACEAYPYNLHGHNIEYITSIYHNKLYHIYFIIICPYVQYILIFSKQRWYRARLHKKNNLPR